MGDITVKEGDSTRCFLDAKGRPIYVVVFKRFVRYQSECTDDEVLQLWSLALDAIEDKNGPQDHDLFCDMRLNAGSFQNVSHLHLKVRMDPDRFARNWAGHPGYEALVTWRREHPKKSLERTARGGESCPDAWQSSEP